MEKIKSFWNKVVKDREQFWDSLFQKYEKNDGGADVDSYLNDSSARIATLLELASEGTGDSPKKTYYEEQESDPESETQVEGVDEVDDCEKEIIEQIASLPKAPEFVTEISADDDLAKVEKTFKFSLFQPKIAEDKGDPDPETVKALSEDSEDSDGSSKANRSAFIEGTVRLIRRNRPEGEGGYSSTPKRFKLA